MLPISHTMPVIENPMTVRASAVLPAAGAWDVAPVELACAGYDHLTIYGSYTRGGAAGAVDIQAEASPYAANLGGVQSWFDQSLMSAGVLAAGADVRSREQREYVTYQATGAAIENFVVAVVRVAGVERIRIRARESGNIAAPGTLHLVAVGNIEA